MAGGTEIINMNNLRKPGTIVSALRADGLARLEVHGEYNKALHAARRFINEGFDEVSVVQSRISDFENCRVLLLDNPNFPIFIVKGDIANV